MISGSPPQYYIKTGEKKGPLPLKSNLNHSSAFPSFENLPVLIFTKLGEKCCLLLDNNSLQKSIKENQEDEILTVCALFVICTRFTTLLSFYIKTGFVFSQSEENNFSCIILLTWQNDLILWCSAGLCSFKTS